MKINMLCVQPRYFKTFHCLGSACVQNCCRYWGQIRWTQDEYEKLIHADMSEELRNAVNVSFKKTEDILSPGQTIYTIDEVNGICPLQDSEGLCSIQKEIGEGYLSQTCIYYPRTSIECGRYVTSICSTSCYGIVDILCNDEMAMELDITEQRSLKMPRKIIGEQKIQKRPILQYSNEIIRFFYDIVSDKSYSLETAMVLGALAAQQFTKLEEKQEYNRVPEAIEALRKQLKDKSQIEKIDSIQPNDNYRIALIYELISKTIFLTTKGLIKNLEFEDNVVSIEKYKEGRRRLAEIFKGREFYRRNIVLNSLLFGQIGFDRNDHSIYDNWLFLCAFFSEIELTMTGSVYENCSLEIMTKCAVSSMGRSYMHNNGTIEITLGFLRSKRCVSPAHIALMLKD